MLLLLAAVLQIAARAALAVASLSRVISVATRLSGMIRRRRVDAVTLQWALGATSLRTGGTCLTQALAARVIMGSTQSTPTLVIGVRRPMNPALSADCTPRQVPSTRLPEFHAWANVDGVCVPRASDPSTFVPLMVWN